MGGAIQPFSSPMLAQGMQGGLSGFGTSGLGMFEKGGLLGKDDLDFLDSINDQDKMRDGGELKRSDLQVGDVVTHKKGKGNAHGRIYKITETAFYLEDKFGNKSERAQYFANDFKKVKRLEDGGQISDIERILAKYRDIQSNQPKKDLTQEFLNKSWEGKNLDDYIMYSDRYKKGGEVGEFAKGGKLSPAQERAFFNKTKTKYTQLDANKLVGNFIEIYGQGQEEAIAYSKISKATIDPKYSEKTLVIYTETGTQERIPEDKIDSFFNGLPIVLSIPSKGSYYGLKLKGANEKDLYADGGEVNKYEATFDQLKKGDVVTLKFGSSISRSNDVKLVVKSKNLVGKGKTYECEKITFAQVNNPNGVKFYAYKRKSGYIGFASGDMGINVTNISVENKFEDGGVTFIEYKDNEIMYEPTFNKYYANDVEFDTLQEAQKFLDSGEMSDSIRGAYSRGLFEKGGELKKPTWIAIYEKGSKRKVFELNANSREEAKIEAEKGKKQYKIPEEMFLYDVFRKFAHGGEVSSTKNYLYEISTPFPAPILAEELEELFGPGRVILNDWNSPEQLESVIMLNLTQNDIDKIQSNIEDAIFSKSEITDPEEMEMLNHFAKGGEVGFIPMGLEEKLALLAKWGGTNIRGVIGLLNAMIDSGITDEDLKYTLLEKETRLRREKAIETKIDQIWTRIQPKYNQELKGNMYYSTLKELITRSSGTYENLLQKFKPFRKYQKFAKGGEIGKNYALIYFADKKPIKKNYETASKAFFDYEEMGSTYAELYDAKGIFKSSFPKKIEYAKGGEIIDQYEGRTPEDIWNNLSKSQRQHFIYDHLEKIAEYKGFKEAELPSSEVIKAYNSDWKTLDKDIKNRFANHTREGQYAKGGEVRDNKFQSNLEEMLKQEGFTISFYDNNVNEMPKNKAEVISLTKFEPYYENFTLKLPSKMEVSFEWIMNKLSNDKVYKSFAENFNKILKAKGYSNLNAYPTSYGIGVFVGFGRGIEETKNQIEKLLNSLGIQYKTEYSNEGYVFRYKISKSKENIAKINEIEMTYAKGGKIGFEGLVNKVAKRYLRKKVSKEYQAEYGKTYDAKEAKEVGNKVAGKVYQQQVAKKKIVRKLQRKTN